MTRIRRVGMHMVAAAAVVLSVAHSGFAELRLPAVFGDHMVLQRNAPLPVWGWAKPGERVGVFLADATAETRAGDDGRWRVSLPAQAAGGPFALNVTAESGQLVFRDVLVGEVWIASGQSNMQWAVRSVANAEAEIAAADYPDIRLFGVELTTAYAPAEDVVGTWQVCSPETVPGFSAVAYFFGRHLHSELDVPVGLINSSWGGTIIEAWTDRASMAAVFDGAERLAVLDSAAVHTPQDSALVAAAVLARERALNALSSTLEDQELAAQMASPDLDDGDWQEMAIPNQWEQSGLGDFDGLVWFRFAVDLPAEWSGRDLVLHMGPVDEIDVTWFNGIRVGGMGDFATRDVQYWDDPRHYAIPGAAVKAGRNVIAVRVIDTLRAGGLWGADPVDMYLTPADSSDDGDVVSVAGT